MIFELIDIVVKLKTLLVMELRACGCGIIVDGVEGISG